MIKKHKKQTGRDKPLALLTIDNNNNTDEKACTILITMIPLAFPTSDEPFSTADAATFFVVSTELCNVAATVSLALPTRAVALSTALAATFFVVSIVLATVSTMVNKQNVNDIKK